jgi:hypothetical protein
MIAVLMYMRCLGGKEKEEMQKLFLDVLLVLEMGHRWRSLDPDFPLIFHDFPLNSAFRL